MAGEVLSGPFLLKRGSTALASAYRGPEGEVVVDLGKKTLRVQDNSTNGGVVLAREDRTISVGTGLAIGAGTSADLSQNFTISVDSGAMASSLVSAKTGNSLTVANGAGEDGGLYIASVPTSALIASGDKLLKLDANDKISTDLSMSYTAATGVLNIIGQDGTTVVATATIPSSVSALTTAELVVNPTISGTPQTGTFMHFVYTLSNGSTSDLYVDVTSLIDIYTPADNSVTVSNYTIAVKISATNPGLEVKNDGLAVKLAAETGNQLQFGANGGLLVPAAAAVTVVSTDSGNILQEGTDDGALLTLAAANNAAQVDANGALIVPLDCGMLS